MNESTNKNKIKMLKKQRKDENNHHEKIKKAAKNLSKRRGLDLPDGKLSKQYYFQFQNEPYGLNFLKNKINQINKEKNQNIKMYDAIQIYKRETWINELHLFNNKKSNFYYFFHMSKYYEKSEITDEEIKKNILINYKLDKWNEKQESHMSSIQGIILSIANKYKSIALSAEKYKENIENIKFSGSDPTKPLSKYLGGFARDIFYAGNSIRHYSEWYEVLNQYKIKNENDEIDLTDSDMLKIIFGRMSKDKRAAESISYLAIFFKLNHKNLNLIDLKNGSFIMNLAYLLNLYDYAFLNKTFIKYKEDVANLINFN